MGKAVVPRGGHARSGGEGSETTVPCSGQRLLIPNNGCAPALPVIGTGICVHLVTYVLVLSIDNGLVCGTLGDKSCEYGSHIQDDTSPTVSPCSAPLIGLWTGCYRPRPAQKHTKRTAPASDTLCFRPLVHRQLLGEALVVWKDANGGWKAFADR